jgi:predicted RNA-binding Zn-ribbon protein involved in translation (DUF1610 family)
VSAADSQGDEIAPDESAKPRLVRRSLAPRSKLCPQCLSELKVATSVSGWLVPNFYVCEKCGYSGYVALEKKTEEVEEEKS